MSRDSQQAITQVLQQDSKVLEQLLIKAKQLKRMQQILDDNLDANLASHCQVANIENGSLIILAESAAFATQLRYQTADILSKLRQHPELCHLKHISCKIRPAVTAPHTIKAPLRPSQGSLSERSAQMILQAAKTIRYDKLKLVMERIAKRIKK